MVSEPALLSHIYSLKDCQQSLGLAATSSQYSPLPLNLFRHVEQMSLSKGFVGDTIPRFYMIYNNHACVYHAYVYHAYVTATQNHCWLLLIQCFALGLSASPDCISAMVTFSIQVYHLNSRFPPVNSHGARHDHVLSTSCSSSRFWRKFDLPHN